MVCLFFSFVSLVVDCDRPDKIAPQEVTAAKKWKISCNYEFQTIRVLPCCAQRMSHSQTYCIFYVSSDKYLCNDPTLQIVLNTLPPFRVGQICILLYTESSWQNVIFDTNSNKLTFKMLIDYLASCFSIACQISTFIWFYCQFVLSVA